MVHPHSEVLQGTVIGAVPVSARKPVQETCRELGLGGQVTRSNPANHAACCLGSWKGGAADPACKWPRLWRAHAGACVTALAPVWSVPLCAWPAGRPRRGLIRTKPSRPGRGRL